MTAGMSAPRRIRCGAFMRCWRFVVAAVGAAKKAGACCSRNTRAADAPGPVKWLAGVPSRGLVEGRAC